MILSFEFRTQFHSKGNMALLQKCSKCHYKNSAKNHECRNCSNNFRKDRNKVWFVDYYGQDGKRKRERVGHSKEAAQQRERQIQCDLTEGRVIMKDKSANLTLGVLLDSYLDLDEVRKQRSYNRCTSKVKALKSLLNLSKKLRDFSINDVQEYIQHRSKEKSPCKANQSISAKTIKEEVATLRRAINLGVQYDWLDKSPIKHWPPIKVENVRERILSEEEFKKLKQTAPPFLWRILVIAYHTGMRQGEIMSLDWNQVDLKKKLIHLRAAQTKSNKGRPVAFNDEVLDMLLKAPRKPTSNKVFLSAYHKPIGKFTTYLRQVFKNSLQKAGIENFVFHDLRHTFVTNKMRAGLPEYAIMKQVGHESTAMLRRYQLVDESDLKCFH